mgnify:CR=1 FL=1
MGSSSSSRGLAVVRGPLLAGSDHRGTVYQNPQDFMYCGEQFGKGYYIAKIHWYRCVRREVLRSYKEERKVSYLSMNAVIQTDGAVKMTKPPSGKRKGELDLSSVEEQTRIFNAA